MQLRDRFDLPITQPSPRRLACPAGKAAPALCARAVALTRGDYAGPASFLRRLPEFN